MLQWLIPAITGALLIKLGTDQGGFLGVAGIAVGGFQVFAALVAAWIIYAKK